MLHALSAARACLVVVALRHSLGRGPGGGPEAAMIMTTGGRTDRRRFRPSIKLSSLQVTVRYHSHLSLSPELET
eukprot:12913534-Prorocentrum_lima.AAC.1